MLTAETVSMCNMCFKEKICGHMAGVVGCDQFAKKIKTNADRIRSKNDQELAEWICSLIIDRYIGVPVTEWLNWLKEEVQDD